MERVKPKSDKKVYFIQTEFDRCGDISYKYETTDYQEALNNYHSCVERMANNECVSLVSFNQELYKLYLDGELDFDFCDYEIIFTKCNYVKKYN